MSMTRRTALQLLGVAAGSSVLFGTHAARSAEQELRIVFLNLWNEAIDPMLSSGNGSMGLAAMYDDLIGTLPDGTDFSKKSGLAEDWAMSPDGKEWTLKIRRGVKFHRNYGELTAHDVKFSLERLASERSFSQFKGYFRDKLGNIEVLDDFTLKVSAKNQPIRDFLTITSALQGGIERFIVSKAAVADLGEAGFARNPVGTGPYMFVKLTGGQSLEMRAVDKHWRLGALRFPTLKILAVPEEETSNAMFQRGDVDVITVGRQNIKRLESAGFSILAQKGANSYNVYLDDQFAPGVPVGHAKVREALNLAVDRQAIVSTIQEGYGRPIGTYYTQTRVLEALGYDWKVDLYPFDPQRAKALLAEAGYPNGFDIDVYLYPQSGLTGGQDNIRAVAGMWSNIGVRPNLIELDYGAWRSKLAKGEMPGAAGILIAPCRPWQSLVEAYRTFMHSANLFTHVKYQELDQLIDGASGSLDVEVFKSKLREAIKFVRTNHLAVPLFETDNLFGVSKRIRNWDPGFRPSNMNFDSLFTAQ